MQTAEIIITIIAPKSEKPRDVRDVLIQDIENLLYEKLCTKNAAFEVTIPPEIADESQTPRKTAPTA